MQLGCGVGGRPASVVSARVVLLDGDPERDGEVVDSDWIASCLLQSGHDPAGHVLVTGRWHCAFER